MEVFDWHHLHHHHNEISVQYQGCAYDGLIPVITAKNQKPIALVTHNKAGNMGPAGPVGPRGYDGFITMVPNDDGHIAIWDDHFDVSAKDHAVNNLYPNGLYDDGSIFKIGCPAMTIDPTTGNVLYGVATKETKTILDNIENGGGFVEISIWTFAIAFKVSNNLSETDINRIVDRRINAQIGDLRNTLTQRIDSLESIINDINSSMSQLSGKLSKYSASEKVPKIQVGENHQNAASSTDIYLQYK